MKAFFLLRQFYLFTVFLYTLYGVFKAADEYFCLQQRADKPDFTELYSDFSLNTTRLFPSGYDYHSVAMNNKIYTFKKEIGINWNPETGEKSYDSNGYPFFDSLFKIEDVLTANYKINESYFNVKCSVKQITEGYYQPVLNGTYLTLNGESIKEIMETGYFGISGWTLMINITTKVFHPNEISCELKKAPETCNIKTETTNLFFKFYAITFLISLAVAASTYLPYRRHLFQRMLFRVYGYFGCEDKALMFCNPVHGKPVTIDIGNEIWTLSDNRVTTMGNQIDKIKDLSGEYFFNNEGQLIIKTDSHFGCYNCDDVTKRLICEYFYRVFENPSKCVVDPGASHFYSTLHVLLHVLNGGGIEMLASQKRSIVLDVKEFEFSMMTKLFPKCGEDRMKKLLEHNWQFFGEGYNLKALKNCLSKKTWSTCNPPDVANTQWKVYTSDFKQLMEAMGIDFFKCQGIRKHSSALKKVLEMNPKEIEIVSIKGKFSIEPELMDTDEEVTNRLVQVCGAFFNGDPSETRIGKVKCNNREELEFFNKSKEYTRRIDEVSKIDFNIEIKPGEKTKERKEKIVTKIIENLNLQKDSCVGAIMDYKAALKSMPVESEKNFKKRLNESFKKVRRAESEKMYEVLEMRRERYEEIKAKGPGIEQSCEMSLSFVKNATGLHKLHDILYKIECYDELLDLLNKFEEKVEQVKLKEAESFKAKTFSNKELIEHMEKNAKCFKMLRRKRGRGKAKQTLKDDNRKDAKIFKESLMSRDFASSLDAAVNLTNNVHEPFTGQRKRTVYTLFHAIKNFLKSKGKRTTYESYVKNKEVKADQKSDEDEMFASVFGLEDYFKTKFLRRRQKLRKIEAEDLEYISSRTGIEVEVLKIIS